MELLPKHPTNDLVTSTQLAAASAALRGEMAELRAEMVLQGTELRTEVNRIENSLTLQLAKLHATTTRLFIGLAGANIIAMVTALVT